MDENILEWLLSDETPEVRLRTLKEYQKLSDDNPKVIEPEKMVLSHLYITLLIVSEIRRKEYSPFLHEPYSFTFLYKLTGRQGGGGYEPAI